MNYYPLTDKELWLIVKLIGAHCDDRADPLSVAGILLQRLLDERDRRHNEAIYYAINPTQE